MKKYYLRLFFALILFSLSTLAFFGFYPVKILNLQFLPLFEKLIFNFSFVVLFLFVFLILITFFFGRIYCSTLCPFGILQELISLINFKKENKVQKNYCFKYFITAITFGFLIGSTALIIKYLEPYTLFGSIMSLNKIGIVALILITILVLLKNRFFCTNICPIGTILGLISKYSLFKIIIPENICANCGACKNVCPTNCIDIENKTVNNENCIKCLKCLDACKLKGIQYKIKKKEKKPAFSIKRREFLISSGLILLFGSAIKFGSIVSKNISEKIKSVILPPGAKNPSEMLNKCLNCNLCINNCPNKILSKANDNFRAVHIDYNLGKKYCEYNCNKCSKVCPSGAIQSITLENKQNTRIALAVINSEICKKCGNCIEICPKKAIEKINNKIVINSEKCIGCGKCKTVCANNSINIFPINKQTML